MKANFINFCSLFFVLIFCELTNAQQSQRFIIPDSLKEFSFEKLESRFDKYMLDISKKEIYANTYYLKSKQQSNKIILANGLYMKAFLYKKEAIRLQYLDSIIALTKDSNDFQYPAKAYLLKARVLYMSDQLNKALENILIAADYSKIAKNIEQSILIKQQIGLLKIELGKPNEALPLVLENFNYYQTKKRDSPYYIYTGWILSDIYNRLKKPEIALSYIDPFLKKIDSLNPYYKYFLLNKGVSYHLKKEYAKSNTSLDISLRLINKIDDPLNLAIGYFYRGENEFNLTKNTNKAKGYFNKVDSILVKNKKYSYDLRDNFLRLIEISKKENDNIQQLYYLNRLIEIDNYLNKNNIVLSEKVKNHYDMPQLLAEKEKIITTINSQKKLYFALGIIIVIGLIVSIFYLFKNKKEKQLLKARFEKLIERTKIEEAKVGIKVVLPENISVKPDEEVIKVKDKTIDLPPELIEDILKKLNAFEKSKHFLNPNLKQTEFAKELGTNSSYLSKVINHCKDKNFSQYLNDLRVEFAINKLKSDKKFRKYTIKSIAEEAGFNNAESFSKSFHTNTGLQPSYFIKKLKEIEEKDKILVN